MNGINRQPLYVKGDYALIAKYNKFDECVEIADINNPDLGWTDYDPTQGASSDELTEIWVVNVCNFYALIKFVVLGD